MVIRVEYNLSIGISGPFSTEILFNLFNAKGATNFPPFSSKLPTAESTLLLTSYSPVVKMTLSFLDCQFL